MEINYMQNSESEPWNSFHCQGYDLESLGFSLEAMLSNDFVGFNKIQLVKWTVS